MDEGWLEDSDANARQDKSHLEPYDDWVSSLHNSTSPPVTRATETNSTLTMDVGKSDEQSALGAIPLIMTDASEQPVPSATAAPDVIVNVTEDIPAIVAPELQHERLSPIHDIVAERFEEEQPGITDDIPALVAPEFQHEHLNAIHTAAADSIAHESFSNLATSSEFPSRNEKESRETPGIDKEVDIPAAAQLDAEAGPQLHHEIALHTENLELEDTLSTGLAKVTQDSAVDHFVDSEVERLHQGHTDGVEAVHVPPVDEQRTTRQIELPENADVSLSGAYQASDELAIRAEDIGYAPRSESFDDFEAALQGTDSHEQTIPSLAQGGFNDSGPSDKTSYEVAPHRPELELENGSQDVVVNSDGNGLSHIYGSVIRENSAHVEQPLQDTIIQSEGPLDAEWGATGDDDWLEGTNNTQNTPSVDPFVSGFTSTEPSMDSMYVEQQNLVSNPFDEHESIADVGESANNHTEEDAEIDGREDEEDFFSRGAANMPLVDVAMEHDASVIGPVEATDPIPDIFSGSVESSTQHPVLDDVTNENPSLRSTAEIPSADPAATHDDFFSDDATQPDSVPDIFSGIAEPTNSTSEAGTVQEHDDFLGGSNLAKHLTEESSGNADVFGTENGFEQDVPEIFSGIGGTNQSQTVSSAIDGAKDIEDSWAKALSAPEAGLDDAWGAVFADDLDDDGFLEDASIPSSAPAQTAMPITAPVSTISPTTASHSTAAFGQRISQAPNAYSSYAPTVTVQQAAAQRPASTTPMEFFADLPTLPVKPKKTRPQAPGFSAAPAVVAPPRIPTMPPPPSASTPAVGSLQGQFRPPERLDLFPPQPQTRTTNAVPPAALPQSYTTQVTAPPANTRYSPAPVQPAIPSVVSLSQSPTSSRYGPAPPQPFPSNTMQPSTIPPARSPYAPSESSAPDMARNASYTRQMPQASQTPPQTNPPPSIAPPRANARYSPAPSANDATPPSQLNMRALKPVARDHSAPVVPLPSAASRFVPRTSSPLAQPNQRPQYDRLATMPIPRPDALPQSPHNRHRSVGDINDPQQGGLAPTNLQTATASQPSPIAYAPPRKVEQQRQSQESYGDIPERPIKRPPKPLERSSSYANYVPPTQPEASLARPRTSSPTVIRANPSFIPAMSDRTTSAQVLPGSVNLEGPISSTAHEVFNYVLPSDETAMDPLQRWRGCPIFTWGPAGSVVTSIPKHIPRYSGGQTAPKLKCISGEVKLQKSKDLFSSQEGLMSFPGPLKTKNKKKDVLSWLNSRIVELERHAKSVPGDLSTNLSDHVRLADQLVLWQVIRIMVEHDGMLSGNPAIVAEVTRTIQLETTTPSESADISSTQTTNGLNTSDSAGIGDNVAAMNEIRQHLLHRDREKATWHAVDNKLWAHAMIISSTGDPKVWKQVVNEFVKHEVRGVQTGNQSLAALYEIFAGNWDDSIDQLVPLSARTSGFQMVSTAQQTGTNVNMEQGLDKWRETLCLVLGNRSTGDEQALLSLGRLLAGYGRIEAAHVCYLFARSNAHFGGADDANAHFTILGADLSPTGSNSGHDLDAIMLSEVYEFALSLPAGSTAYYIPHLQAYKLHHAYALAEAGMRGEAQQYCDAIVSATKASTRLSPYYHPTLTSQLDDLAKRISQTPKDTSGGLFSKPTVGKVSRSLGSMINKFIEGDDTAKGPNGTANGAGEAGPFAQFGGGMTPTISRSPSGADLQGYGYNMSQPPATADPRYAPASYFPPTLADVGRSMSYAPSTPYAPSTYNPSPYGSPEQIQRQRQPQIGSDGSTSSYALMPSAPALNRQASSLSRHSSNERPGRPISSPIYEPQVQTISETATPDFPTVSPPQFGNRYSPARNSNHAPSPLGLVEAVSTDEGGYDGAPSYGGYLPMENAERYETGLIPNQQERSHSPSAAGDQRSSMDSQTGYMPQDTPYNPGSSYDPFNIVQDVVSTEAEVSQNSYQPYSSGYAPLGGDDMPSESENVTSNTAGYTPTTSGYEPSGGGYDPLGGGYQPSSYTPYEPDESTNDMTAEDAEDAPKKPKKKSFLDDDDDDFISTSSKTRGSGQGRSQPGREVDDAVRLAAEADAARDKAAAEAKKAGGSWLSVSGWFGGASASKKEAANGPTVYKAKLGEENSFVFDPDTKRWVNRKAQASSDSPASPVAATPPPPRAGPPMGGMSAPPTPPVVGIGPGGNAASRTSSPAMPPMPSAPQMGGSNGGSRPPSLGAMGPSGGGPPGSNIPLPGSAPPSRPSTGMGNASDIDDLLGGSGAPRAGGTVGRKAKKGARYVDVMAK